MQLMLIPVFIIIVLCVLIYSSLYITHLEMVYYHTDINHDIIPRKISYGGLMSLIDEYIETTDTNLVTWETGILPSVFSFDDNDDLWISSNLIKINRIVYELKFIDYLRFINSLRKIKKKVKERMK